MARRERDQPWAAMYTAAERLTARYCMDDSLQVTAYQRRNLTNVVQGIKVWDKWTDYMEPVRERRYFSSGWTELQPIQEAASKIGAFLRDRPDLEGCEYCRDQANRDYHLDHIGSRPDESDLLKRCPRCRTLWDCAPFGREDEVPSTTRARKRYPNVDLSDV